MNQYDERSKDIICMSVPTFSIVIKNESLKPATKMFQLFMVDLWNRADHYIYILFLLPFFPRQISAVGDWMSTILRHMVWS